MRAHACCSGRGRAPGPTRDVTSVDEYSTAESKNSFAFGTTSYLQDSGWAGWRGHYGAYAGLRARQQHGTARSARRAPWAGGATLFVDVHCGVVGFPHAAAAGSRHLTHVVGECRAVGQCCRSREAYGQLVGYCEAGQRPQSRGSENFLLIQG